MKKANPNIFDEKDDLSKKRLQKDKLKDLIEGMLAYSPNTRKKPLELLSFDFFEELREEDVHK